MIRTSTEQGMLRTNGTIRIENVRRSGGTWRTGVSVVVMETVDDVDMRTERSCCDLASTVMKSEWI